MTVEKLPLRAMLSLAATIGGPIAGTTPAVAQCQLCAPSSAAAPGKADLPLQIEIGTALDFDRLAPNGSIGGTATIDPVSRTRIVSAGLSAHGGLFTAGGVTVRGEPGRAVRVVLPTSVTLRTPAGATATISQLVTSLPSAPRLGSDGTLRFAFGGRLNLSGGVNGDFRGDVTITVDYQ